MNRLEEIKEREAKATKGPWHSGYDYWIEPKKFEVKYWQRQSADEEGSVQRPIVGIWPIKDRTIYLELCIEPEDSAFIAHAREDIPWLIAEVENVRWANKTLNEHDTSQKREIDRLRAEVERLRGSSLPSPENS